MRDELRAAEFHKKRINSNWSAGEYPYSKMFKTEEEALESMMQQWSFGEPHVITI